ncbi:helix-turn-helix transcriptional regulator [Propionibacterium australiense]|uniref:WYL domain-containing protein n=1 Tax=Propionibacterium australiense TaxID=119981 RepID=A0A8B3GGD1_9ACTN|nr:WYL domain-containing protein [Propionibacterium australiense]RLP06604.1 WYL domain-containing protein [Propionibacterium australiense]RLP10770.1 WYL domain-containing protein [Propionibacterium australiense]
MAQRTSERLVNLTIALLSARHWVSKEQLRELVTDYREMSPANFDRMFERDKRALRSLGVPIATGSDDGYFKDEPGYRIIRHDFELPPVTFDPDELSALALASRVWREASVASDTISAIAKLRAAGAQVDSRRFEALAPRISASEPAFDVCWQATLDRTRINFGYRGADELRTVQPWRLTWRRGSWYLLGFDEGRQAPRMFKLGRISSGPDTVGGPGAFTVPDGTDVDALSRSLEPAGPDTSALVAVRGGCQPWLTRRGTPVDSDVDLPEDFQCWRIDHAAGDDLAAQIAAAGPDAVVLEPAELRAEVVRLLRISAGRQA